MWNRARPWRNTPLLRVWTWWKSKDSMSCLWRQTAMFKWRNIWRLKSPPSRTTMTFGTSQKVESSENISGSLMHIIDVMPSSMMFCKMQRIRTLDFIETNGLVKERWVKEINIIANNAAERSWREWISTKRGEHFSFAFLLWLFDLSHD